MRENFTFFRNHTSKFRRNVSYLRLLGCSVRNRTRFYFSRISVSSDQLRISYRMNGKFYVCSKFSVVVFYVTLRTLRHVTLRYVRIDMYGSTVCYDTLQFLTFRYVTWGWKTGITLTTRCTALLVYRSLDELASQYFADDCQLLSTSRRRP